MGIGPHAFWLTGKRAILSVAGLVVLGAVVLALAQAPRATKNADATASGADSSSADGDLLIDTDGDGLKNWEEALWHTDPNKSDTDGDGVPDGQEVKESRDPLAKGAGSLGERQKDLISSDGALTTELSKAIIDSGAIGQMLDKQNPPATTPTAYLQKVGDIYYSSEAKAIENAVSLLHYKPDSSPVSVKNYFNAVAQIFTKHFSKFKTLDVEVASEIIKSSEGSRDVTALDPFIGATKAVIADISALDAPLEAREFHERGIGVLTKTLFEIEGVRGINEDPALALIAISQRFGTMHKLSQLYNVDVWVWFKTRNISFEKSEPMRQLFDVGL